MIRWSLEKMFWKNSYRRSDDHIKNVLEIPSPNYRWSDDHISVFLPNATDDPTITFRFFCRTLPMIRRSQFGFFAKRYLTLPMIRRSPFGFFAKRYRWSDDHKSVFLPNATDDPTIKCRFFVERCRWSDDQYSVFLLNATGYPTIKFWFSGRTLRDLTPWNPKSSYVGGFFKNHAESNLFQLVIWGQNSKCEFFKTLSIDF